jgi:hypothetical protein
MDHMFNTHTDHWNDCMNDTFVDKWNSGWRVTQRQPGNRIAVISKHRKLDRALAAANKIAHPSWGA